MFSWVSAVHELCPFNFIVMFYRYNGECQRVILRPQVYRLTTLRISSAQPHMLKYNFFSIESVSEFCIRRKAARSKAAATPPTPVWEICEVKDANVVTTTYNNNFIYYIMNWKRRSVLFNRITSDTGHVSDDLLPPKRNKVLRERGHDDFILPTVKTERFKRAFVNRCIFKLSLNIFQLKSFF